MIIVSLFDRTAQSYRSVAADVNEQTAKRNLAYAVNNTPQLLFESKDLELVKVAEFDDHTGVVVPVVPPLVICRASEVIQND